MSDFPKPPNWKKVENTTMQIVDLLDMADLTFTEKYSIIQIIHSTIDREFNMSMFALLQEPPVIKDERPGVQ